MRLRIDAATPEQRRDPVYKPFFKAAILITLSFGAAWGAYLLIRIALEGSFTAVGIHAVNAHGHAQIFGWVGLFVMGFGYYMLPRLLNMPVIRSDIAMLSFWMMLIGIVLRTGGQTWLAAKPSFGLAITGNILELFAIGTFVSCLTLQLVKHRRPWAPADGFILAGLAWFFIQAVYSTIYFVVIALAPNREMLLWHVSVWQAPLRDLQIHGFALMMILGVSHVLFVKLYHFPAPSRKSSWLALAVINLAIVGEVAGLILLRTVSPAASALWYLSVLSLFGAVLTLLWKWRIFGAPWRMDRGVKFIRAAYIWLVVSLAMLVALPFYQLVLLPWLAPDSHAVSTGFSHAYYGAGRHAITVGFISMMIVGVASKFVPVMNGVRPDKLPGLWSIFLMLNIGCASRVVFQTMTDFSAAAFIPAGLSGLIELTALTLWGVHLYRLMPALPVFVPSTWMSRVA